MIGLRHPVAERFCRCCGCTDTRACVGGCIWVLLDIDAPSGICSACAIGLKWEPHELAAICEYDRPAWPGLGLAS